MDSILGMITPEITQTLAADLGASVHSVHSGLGISTAVTLGMLASRAADSGFVTQIIGVASSASGQNILSSLSSLSSGGTSGAASDLVSRFLPLVFGSQQSTIANAITQQTGVGVSSAAGLLKVAALLVLGYLGKMQSAGSLNISSLVTALKSELPKLDAYLPSGLLTALSDTFGSPSSGPSAIAIGDAAAPTRSPWWLIPAATIGLLALVVLVFRSVSGPAHGVTAASRVRSATGRAAHAPRTAANTASNAATAARSALGGLVKITLPDGTVLSAPSRGVELRLVSYLSGSSTTVGRDTWFDFDRVLFDSGTATLQPASEEQLNNIAAILKAYPSAQVRLVGHTDYTGDAQANVKLSEDRAENVMAELVKAGVDASRLDAEGYGEDHPIAGNSSEEGRQKNPRISIRVAQR
jgi:outer membrane protein OmpA-like peptidoglycan-associated protein